jgi:hypothetical protein
MTAEFIILKFKCLLEIRLPQNVILVFGKITLITPLQNKVKKNLCQLFKLKK